MKEEEREYNIEVILKKAKKLLLEKYTEENFSRLEIKVIDENNLIAEVKYYKNIYYPHPFNDCYNEELIKTEIVCLKCLFKISCCLK